MTGFVDRVLAEASLWSSAGRCVAPKTVFFGGGTPSLLPLPQMKRLIQKLGRHFDLSNVTEFTIEVNPATASLEYLFMLNENRVDRLSLGAQSFDRAELAMLERHHDPDGVAKSVELARRAGFERLNIDLIYAIPGQSLDSWERSLRRAIELKLTHYSCYGLTYESNTPITVRKRLGEFQAADEQLELAMLHHARRQLSEAGCPPYEISNYAAPAQQCLHNLMYWRGGNYIGLGPSAASHVEGYRFKNRPHLGEWEQSIDTGELPAADVERLSARQRADELVMLGLRLTGGISFAEYTSRTGLDARVVYESQLDRLSKLGLVRVDNNQFALTEAGLNVADTVAGEFFQPSN
jgi:oxygen-independent coproporphyrinogen-3 oxidase